MSCVKVCPEGAISAKKSIKYDIAGKKTGMAVLNREKCYWCHDGFNTKTFGPMEFAQPENLTMDYFYKMETAAMLYSPMWLHRRFVTFTEGGWCGLCLIECPKGDFNPK